MNNQNLTPHPGLAGSVDCVVGEQKQSNRQVLSRLLRYFLEKPGSFFQTLFTSLMLTLSTLILPYWIGKLIDHIQPGTAHLDRAYRLQLLLFALCWLLVLFFQYLNNRSNANLMNYLSQSLRTALYQKLPKLPFSHLDRWSQGEWISLLTNDLEAVKEGFSIGILVVLFQGLSMIGSLILLFYLHWGLGVLLFFLSPLSFFLNRFVVSKSKKFFTQQQKILGKMTQLLKDDFEEAAYIRTFDWQTGTEQNYQNWNNELQAVGEKAQYYSSLTNPVARFGNNTIYLVMALASAYWGQKGMLTYGAITAALSYVFSFTAPINQLSTIWGQLQNAVVAADRAFSFCDYVEEERKVEKDFQFKKGEIEFQHVDFSYPGGKKLYQDFNLKIPAGATVALVGETGCGKTTLVQLLMQFYHLQGGKILIDGQDISKCSLDSLYKTIGWVSQESWLFHGTIAENIAYAVPHATKEQIQAAAHAVRADHFIEQLPQGYQTLFNPREDSLAEGQKQLITVARLYLKNPDIFILDEATSQVDIQTEKQVQLAFEKITKNRTCLVIAHRLATIEAADWIVYLSGGKILEMGKHEELLARQGAYAELYWSQFH